MNFLKSSFSKVAKHKTFDYEPRFAKEEKKLPLEERIRFQKGAMLNKPNTLASKRGKLFAHRDKMTTQRKMTIYFLLLALMADIYFLYKYLDKGWTYIVLFLSLLLILLVALIRTNNQR